MTPTRRCLAVMTTMLVTALAAAAAIAETPGQPDDPDHKLVLVLSGGGARGAAHIGVLKVLEELRVAPDLIVGTSMGSVVGGLYASGWSPDEMAELVATMDWNAVFSDDVPRREKSFRRKQDDRPVLIDLRLHFQGFKPYVPPGLVGGQSLELLMDAIQAQSATATDLDHLNVPFRAVAADLATGQPVVIDDASLATAMRASMSIPGAFAPVELDGRFLVDGGAVANLPVKIAKDLGATAVIAVDISTPIDPSQTWSFLSVSRQVTSLMTEGYRDRDVELLTEQDLLLEPDLDDLAFTDFNRAAEAVELGEVGARARAADLARYAVDDAQWAAFLERQRRRPRSPVVIDRVRVENSSRLGDAVVRRAIPVVPGDELAPDQLAHQLLELHALRTFGIIDFNLDGDGPERELVVRTPPPPHGRGSLQFGFGFSDDFNGNTGYTLSARHQLLPANRRGGEWQNVVQLGTVGLVDSQFYQPLDAAMRWFVEPSAGYRRELADLWFDGTPFVQYEIEGVEARLAGGRVLGKWGELRATTYVGKYRALPRIGNPIFPSDEDRRGGVQLGFRIDTVDQVAFATRGTAMWLLYERSLDALGTQTETDLVHGRIEHSFSFGRNTIRPYLEYGENFEPTGDYINLFKLGGLGRLSGLGDDELLGEKVALARLLGQRRLTGFRLAGINVEIYAGVTLEAGNVYAADEAISSSSLRTAWSGFVGANTPLGPVYVGYGRSASRDRFYLLIGDRF